MTNQMQQITFEQWKEMYKPIQNRKDAPFDGLLFEEFSPEYETVYRWQSTRPAYVWTLLTMGGRNYIVSGNHIINRVGYLLTDIPFAGYGMGSVLNVPVLSNEDAMEENLAEFTDPNR